MIYDDTRNPKYRHMEHKSLVVLLLIGSLALIPLGCASSSADSQSEEASNEQADAQATEPVSYDVPEYTDERSVQQQINDASLVAQIKRALVRQRALRVFDFEPEVDGKVVTLRGDVNTKAQWEQVGEVTERIARGRDVVNAVTVGGRPADEVDADEPATESTTAVFHTVRSGESLWEIARQYGASVQRLRSLNGTSSQNLHVGERIRVR
jgi:nucleoid-associated protein YgaU